MMNTEQPSGWAAGWSVFAAIMLVIVGVFGAIAGIEAIAGDDQILVTQEYVFKFDTTTWGWIHLILGTVLVLAGIGIFSGNVLARTVGVIAAGLNAIANFMWLPYHPVWSVIVIAIDVAVIWALTAHGRDLQELDAV